MTWVQWTVAIYLAFHFVAAFVLDGETRKPEWNGSSILSDVFFWLFVLYAGGFWK